ncbi:MAG TPA: hypothetical protein GXX18_05285 [Bacillales bacterium]|nr:hypothetical protein [Bacillales bacterium]
MFDKHEKHGRTRLTLVAAMLFYLFYCRESIFGKFPLRENMNVQYQSFAVAFPIVDKLN